MKKILCLLIAALLHFSFLYAQAPHIEKSEEFDVPVNGWNKVLQMKNGNTFFFHFTKKEGINVMIFDKSRKVVADKSLTSDLWDSRKMKQTGILGLYEINGEPVLFMMQAEGRTPTLYRLRFNPFNGDIVKEEEIGELPKTKLFNTNPYESNNIYVEKDAESDCYAVIYFNSYASDRDERIHVVHYDGSHKVINDAYYDSPDENFKYLHYIGAVVDGNKRLYLTTYGANSLKGRDAHVFISRLNVGDSMFTNKALDFTEDFKDTKSIMYYNHISNKLQLLTLSYAAGHSSFFTGATKRNYVSFLAYIDPESLNITSVKPIIGDKINEYAHNTLGLDKLNYHGLPQQMIINKDNSITVLSEDQTQEVTYDARTHQLISARTYLGAIGVSELNDDGTEKAGYVIMKVQMAGGLIDPLYISSRSKGRWQYQHIYEDYNSFLSYDYVNTDKGRYIIFNDDNKNFEKDEDQRRRKIVTNLKRINTICYQITNGTVNKFFLFGDPDDNDKASYCYIDASDYCKANNTYATVVVERKNGSSARMAWVTFE